MTARGREPHRTCVGCRRVRPKRELVRLVVRDGSIVDDPEGTAAGRGAYVCPDEACRRGARVRAAKALRAPGAGWIVGETG